MARPTSPSLQTSKQLPAVRQGHLSLLPLQQQQLLVMVIVLLDPLLLLALLYLVVMVMVLLDPLLLLAMLYLLVAAVRTWAMIAWLLRVEWCWLLQGVMDRGPVLRVLLVRLTLPRQQQLLLQ